MIDLKVFEVKPTDLEQSAGGDDPCADFSMGGSQLHTFASPKFPANYPPSLECIRVVNAPKGYDITVDFRGTYFEVGCFSNPDDACLSLPALFSKNFPFRN